MKRKKHLEERAEAALNNREEGEVSSSTTPIHSPGVTQHTTSNSFDTALHPQSRTVLVFFNLSGDTKGKTEGT